MFLKIKGRNKSTHKCKHTHYAVAAKAQSKCPSTEGVYSASKVGRWNWFTASVAYEYNIYYQFTTNVKLISD